MDPNHDKLLFEAVLYVLDDMPPNDREVFEQRLLDEQAAREAVAEATRICEITYQALHEMDEMVGKRFDRGPTEFFDPEFAIPTSTEPTVISSISSAHVQTAEHVDGIWSRAAVWTAMAVAASILIVIVAGVGRDRTPRDGKPTDIVSSDGDDLPDSDLPDQGKMLAVAWLNSASLNDATDEDLNDDVGHDESMNDETPVDDEEIALVEKDGPAQVPEADWLFEAVTAPPAESAGTNTGKPQEG
jgi:hypothetical protein